VLLIGYAFLGEGYGVRSRAVSLTLLDQAAKQAATRSSVSLYAAGLTPSGGLRFDRNLAVFPFGTDGLGVDGDQTLDLTESQRYTGATLQARTPSNLDQIGVRTARERLTLERDTNGFRVVNGLGADISRLYYRDGGILYALDKPLSAGDRGTLTTASLEATDFYLKGLEETPLNPARFANLVFGQADGSYLAVLEKSPFWEPGVERLDERGSFHVVLGFGGLTP
jgi:hypothetical protein